jgi:hypothetical protein
VRERSGAWRVYIIFEASVWSSGMGMDDPSMAKSALPADPLLHLPSASNEDGEAEQRRFSRPAS